MSQDFLINMECIQCKHINYTSRKNKKLDKERLEVKKFCKFCKGHAMHKETK